ncbi:MAG: hypothetical protein D6795_08640 [Deltaproteobacteria bacterium]|nr:MAG: hypothetical protein D6795_08640 [Deltaproteobacteria bacterium]
MVGYLPLYFLLLVTSAHRVPPHDNLNATLWMSHAAEYRMVVREIYAAAQRSLDAALADPTWHAALEQGEDAAGLPPAIIVDIDETVLDNTPYQARLVRENTTYSPASWQRWVREARARALPGAKAFLQYAAGRGVRVFYVTNRDAQVEEATRKNLVSEGLPLAEGEDTVLTRHEREGWGSDKTSRRAYVAQRYRILLLLGDDLNDFVSGARTSPSERLSLARRHEDAWGSKWFLFPNPTYGSWEGALYDFEYRRPTEEKRLKKHRYLLDRPLPE